MNEVRKKIYDEWREEFTHDPAKAVGWRNQESLDARFNCTLRHLAHKDFSEVSILDYGCGASLNLLRYLPQDPYEYLGVDCNHDSLALASKNWHIAYNDRYSYNRKHLMLDEYLEKLDGQQFDVILSQGVYQEFNSIADVGENVRKLCSLLAPKGELLIMTPVNRKSDFEGRSVLRLSAFDAISILESTGLPYELFLGELGEHIIMRVYKE